MPAQYNETDCDGFLLYQVPGVKRSALSEQTFEEQQQMVPELLMVDLVGHNTALCSCERGQQWKRAFVLLQQIRSQGLTGNEFTYNAATSAYGKGQR